ncbi:MAG: heavy metal-responsive transcriptional regulator [Chloroflexi bacterium]|nr:heavy metal-responsive transcriptional regulator [Chloroflexota bacterium]
MSNQSEEPPMRICDLAEQTGVSPPTIRYYEKIGILPPAQRADNGYRAYRADDMDRVHFVVRARSLDFSLDEIREILAFRERGETPCAYVLGQIDGKLAEIDRRMAALAQMKAELRQLQAAAEEIPLAAVEAKNCVCHLIESHYSTQRSEK